MKIVYVITRADAVGGASIHVRDLASAMLERGHQATVLVGGEGPVTEQFTRAGVPFRTLRFLRRAVRPVRDLRALAELTAALRDEQPDLVSTHTAKAGWIGRAACARTGLPAVYTPHGWSIADRISPARGAAFALAEKAASRWANAIICVCEYERQLALRSRIAAAEKLHVVHNGVRDVPEELRARPGLHPVRIVSVARFESPKDHGTLLQALAALRSQDWQLDLIGDGPREAETRELARSLGIGERVHFLGYQDDPAQRLAGAQVFALSSVSEAFPRSVLEAMRAGLPVVASDVGGLREAVTDGESGILVPRKCREALSSALENLIADAALRQRLGTAARLTYEAKFRFESMVEKTVAVYEKILFRTGKSQNSL